eukprot:TRINITY_DN6355_c0_g1_i2.p1 TRINITY_DN6355_c0_g1~~TRINITY_DN6355_c0_g1_i2.p1  ORF type:complete len:1116 (-),score=259.45 TRINITY_DN6355_c0_g1_i2:43-3390(-)
MSKEERRMSLTGSDTTAKSNSPAVTQQQATILLAICDFQAETAGELRLQRGDKIVLLRTDKSGWAKGKKRAIDASNNEITWKIGWFPLDYVKEYIPPTPPAKQLNPQRKSPSKENVAAPEETFEWVGPPPNSHKFARGSYRHTAPCEVCGESVLGFSSHQLRCSECGLVIHKLCFDKSAPSCPSLAENAEKRDIPEWEQKDVVLQRKIDVLLSRGENYSWSNLQDDQRDDAELDHFRYKYFTSARLYAEQHEDVPVDISLSPVVDYDLEKVKMPLPKKFPVTFHFPSGYTKTILCDGEKTVEDALYQLFRFVGGISSPVPDPLRMDHYFVKIVGMTQYLDTLVQLERFEWIRDSLGRSKEIALCLVKKTAVLGRKLTTLTEMSKNKPADKDNVFERWEEINSVFKPPRLSKSDCADAISHLNISEEFQVTIHQIDNYFDGREKAGGSFVFCEISILHGDQLLAPSVVSEPITSANCNVVVKQDTLRIWQLPKASRVMVTMFTSKNRVFKQDSANLLGWTSLNLVSATNEFVKGKTVLRLWPNNGERPNIMRGTCVQNYSTPNPIKVTIDFSSLAKYEGPIIFKELVEDLGDYNITFTPDQPNTEDLAKLLNIIDEDPLYEMSEDEKELVLDNRYFLRSNVKALTKILLCIPWHEPALVGEAIRALNFWKKVDPPNALELLGRFYDPTIRSYTVSSLKSLSDRELAGYLPQLVQCLKYEPWVDSSLCQFILYRALNAKELGMKFYWCLKSEMHVAHITERYSLILETYLRGCGDLIDQFIAQQKAIEIIRDITSQLKKDQKYKKGKISFQAEIPEPFVLPFNCNLIAKSIIAEDCKVMDSARMPLRLVFENADRLGKPIPVIFKSGDDLRQDMLCLQMMTLMDQAWKNAGFEFGMQLYGVTATGENEGFIQVVENSATIASIHKRFGTFKESGVHTWLREKNPIIDEAIQSQNFLCSCAAYCVATYVLGIGDRHNDNIMLHHNGHLFHIDFGHFLGRVKKWAGISRERAPFVLTPDFAYVMKGKDSAEFQRFVELCCDAFLCLRRNANTIINLFSMMLSTGIAELTCFDDIRYLRRAFMLDTDNLETVVELFKKLIYESLNTKTTRINFWIHNMVH